MKYILYLFVFFVSFVHLVVDAHEHNTMGSSLARSFTSHLNSQGASTKMLLEKYQIYQKKIALKQIKENRIKKRAVENKKRTIVGKIKRLTPFISTDGSLKYRKLGNSEKPSIGEVSEIAASLIGKDISHIKDVAVLITESDKCTDNYTFEFNISKGVKYNRVFKDISIQKHNANIGCIFNLPPNIPPNMPPIIGNPPNVPVSINGKPDWGWGTLPKCQSVVPTDYHCLTIVYDPRIHRFVWKQTVGWYRAL